MPISIYEEDIYENGEVDYLVAEGIVIKHDLDAYPFFSHVKWFCRIDSNGIQNKPELRKEAAQNAELKAHGNGKS
ncbi:MAG: hypothetical protein NC086_08790 [Alistipes sp.]|nr:hypothetical protein [Alistipes sp.]